MKRLLPSLNALRAFEAAGRHTSFSRAAEELHVTPAAVGQQVRALESYLGEALFVRLNRSVELTVAGQALLPGVSDGFDQLARTMEAFYRRTVRRPLTVSVEPNFGAKWLVRRLDRFRERHPGIEIRLDATARVVDFAREAVDLAIRYGDGNYPGLRCDILFEEDVFPVCSPALLEGPHPLEHPEDLAWHALLRQEWAPGNPTWPGLGDVAAGGRGRERGSDPGSGVRVRKLRADDGRGARRPGGRTGEQRARGRRHRSRTTGETVRSLHAPEPSLLPRGSGGDGGRADDRGVSRMGQQRGGTGWAAPAG